MTSLFESENLYIRGQAIDVFVQVTAHPAYDWFRPARSDSDKALHAALAGLAPTGFLESLAANCPPPFPGASFYCLQIMGFWLSWLRSLYSGKSRYCSVSCVFNKWVGYGAMPGRIECVTRVVAPDLTCRVPWDVDGKPLLLSRKLLLKLQHWVPEETDGAPPEEHDVFEYVWRGKGY